jgi:hypothetical protein
MARRFPVGAMRTSRLVLWSVAVASAACSSISDGGLTEEPGLATQGLLKSLGGVNGQGDYCGTDPADQCGVGEGDCDSNAQCLTGLVCNMDVGANYGFSAATDVCGGPVPGAANFCSASNRCAAGQGDCDSNAECQTGLACTADVGASYGFSATTDVCEGAVLGSATYCSTSHLCAAGQGDCDSAAECMPGLRCASNVGANYGWSTATDVCEGYVLGSSTYCAPSRRCADGEGDCDSDADCQDGLQCISNVGPNYGWSADTDVCEGTSTELCDETYCSVSSLCGEGEGDCDSNSECEDGYACVNDIGANSGCDASVDLCESACTPASPCGHGQGDCDTNDDCVSGTACTADVGATYGYGASVDVCVTAATVEGSIAAINALSPVAFYWAGDGSAIYGVEDTGNTAAGVQWKQWLDLSGLGNATQVQPTRVSQPTVTLDGSDNGLRFSTASVPSGNLLVLPTTVATAVSGTVGLSLFLSLNQDTLTPAAGAFIFDLDGSEFGITEVSAGTMRVRYGSAALYAEVTPAAGSHLYSYVYDGSQADNATRLKLWQDATQLTANFAGTVPATLTPISGGHIGRYSTMYYNGVIHSVLLFNRALTTQEVSTVRTNMAVLLNYL